MKGTEVIGQGTSIEELAKLIGCTRAHIYKAISNNSFNYKKITYTILDRLDF